MARRLLVMGVAALATLLLAGAGHALTCSDPHYRWSEKTDASLVSQKAAQIPVSGILRWAPLRIYAGSKGKGDYCAPRQGRELRTYSVLGWVRKWKREGNDQDFHIEITGTKSGDRARCIIVEIPPDEAGPQFAAARQEFLSLLGSQPQNKNLGHPVRMRFIGAAFFDGAHWGRNVTKGHGHGGCNVSVWEIHPVYAVRSPGG